MATGPNEETGKTPMSLALQATLVRAREYAAAQAHAQVTLEHLLLSLTEDEDANAVLQSSSMDVARVRNDVAAYLGDLADRIPSGTPPNPAISQALTEVLGYATLAARQGRRQRIDGAIVLATLIGDGKSMAASFLTAQGLTFQQVVKALQRGTAPSASPPVPTAPHSPYPAPLPAPLPEPGHGREPSGSNAPHSTTPSSAARTEDILAAARERVESRTLPPARSLAAVPPQRAAAPQPSGLSATDPRPPEPPQPPTVQPSPAVEQPGAMSPPDTGLRGSGREPQLPFPTGLPSPAKAPGPPAIHLPEPPASSAPARPIASLDRPEAQHEPQAPMPLAFAEQRHEFVVSAEARQNGASGSLPEVSPPPANAQRQLTGWAPPPLPAPSPGVQGVPPRPTSAPPPPRPAPSAPPAAIDSRAQRPALPIPAPWTGPAPNGPEASPEPQHRQEVQRSLDAKTTSPTAPPVPRRPPPSESAPAPDAYRSEVPRLPPLDAGKIEHTLPRTLKAGRTASFEVRVGRPPMAGVPQGPAPYSLRSERVSHRAISARLRAGKPGLRLELASPETQWDQTNSATGRLSGETAVWRYTITPVATGKVSLSLQVSARTVAADGVVADMALPETLLETRVVADWGGRLKRWGIVAAVSLGSVIAVEVLELLLAFDLGRAIGLLLR